MKHINTWRPDTCGCELHYEWDDTLTPEERVHVPVESFTDSSGNLRIHRFCENHIGISNIQDLHKHVIAENSTKNLFLGHIIENHPRLVDVKDDGGGETKLLKNHIKYEFSFSGKDHERKLHINLIGADLTDEERASLNAHAETLEKPIELF